MAQVEVTMPKMGESITEGTIIAWHKKPGDTVELDETLLEIGTDKVDTDVPSPAGGVVKQILVDEGDTVDVGAAIAVIETDVEAGGDGQSEAPAPEPEAKAAAEPAPEPAAEAEETDAAAPAAVESAGSIVEVVMPKMGESITEGTIISWHKNPGDKVELDETLLEIGTDKVDTEVPSPAEGVLQQILVPEGETVDVGSVIATLTTDLSAEGAAPVAPAEPAAATAAAQLGDERVSEPDADTAQAGTTDIPRKDDDGSFYSPLVRSIAKAEGVTLEELKGIKGSGREGRLTKDDLKKYLEERKSAPAPSAPKSGPPQAAPARKPSAQPQAAPSAASLGGYDGRTEIVEMERMRQIIAEHMVRSKATSAHVTSFAEVDVTNLVRFRDRQKDEFLEREGFKLTFTPFFVHAAAEALREHPVLNSSVEGTQIVLKKDLHIGIAVAIGRTGLLAPVIRDAGEKNVTGIARIANDLAERARNKKLQPDELQGGTFTVTNIGSLGSIMGTPIINQPQVAILATGAIKKRPAVIEDPVMGDVIAVRHMMYLSLSYDHRIIDGAMAASFMQKIVRILEAIDPNGKL